MSTTVEFDYIRRTRDEYLNVYLDSKMNIADRIKWAGEIPKILGNFHRLHREVTEIAELLINAFEDGCIELRRHVHENDPCDSLDIVLERLNEIAEEWPT
jgi:hypothetical protein